MVDAAGKAITGVDLLAILITMIVAAESTHGHSLLAQ
jgi:hypothetical protein